MNRCIDCDKELKGHGNAKRCLKCNGIYRSIHFKHSNATKEKISISKTKTKEDKKCIKCLKKIGKYNKTGLCISCCKKGSWHSGLKINELEFIKSIDNPKNGYEIWEFRCFCGNLFKAIASKVNIGRTRSCGCLNKEHCRKIGELQRGENSAVWIKDRTKLSDFIRNNKGSWQALSKKYKKKKNYTCELTGEIITSAYNLHVHHIESVTLNPELTLEINNLICIKKEIHNKFHSIYGKKTVKSQWDEFVEKFYNIKLSS